MGEMIPTLETERLILRGFTAADFDAFAAIWGDRAVVRHITGTPLSASDSWSRLLRLAGGWALLGFGYWAVVDRATDRLAGMAGFADFKREIDIDIDGLPEAGWVFAPQFHGRGYATEAMRAACAWADGALAADRSCCLIDPDNAASINVANKLGFGDARRAAFGAGETLVLFREAPAR